MDTRIIQLLARKLSGEATADELMELEELLTRNPEGVYYAELISQLWGEGKMRNPSNTDIAYLKHIARHRPDFIPSNIPVQRKRHTTVWLVAAIIILIPLGYLLFHTFPHTAHPGDRDYWLEQMDKMARPVIYNLAQDHLKKTMPVILSKRTDDPVSRTHAAYLEAFARTISGIAPWLGGEGGSPKERALREQYRTWILPAIAHATDTTAADYMAWDAPGQALVDAAFFAFALVRCPWIWQHLDTTIRRQVVTALVSTRKIKPGFNNWLLFSGMIEAFFCKYGLPWDEMRVDYAIHQLEQWYVGDGLYSDGPGFHDDYYNSYVIHPFLTAITEIVLTKNDAYGSMLEKFRQRDLRYALIQERLINTDGSYPVLGRSVVYRGAVFQHLADMAWQKKLPVQLKPSQVRCALTAVLRKTMGSPSTYTKDGWLNIGVYGSQPEQADSYNTTGSLYLCSEILLPLGLPDTDEFWSAAPEPWTAQKIWSGQDVSGDHSID